MCSLTVIICNSRISCKSCQGRIPRQQPLFLKDTLPVTHYHLGCYQPQPHVVRQKAFLYSLSKLDKNMQLNVLTHLPQNCTTIRARVTLLKQSLFGDCSLSRPRKINRALQVTPAIPKLMNVSPSSVTDSDSQPPKRVVPSSDYPKLPKPQPVPIVITPGVSSRKEESAGISFSRRLETRSSPSMPDTGHTATSRRGPVHSSSAKFSHQPPLEANEVSRVHSSTAQALSSTGKNNSNIETLPRRQSSSRQQKRSTPTFVVVKDTEDFSHRNTRDVPHNSTIYLASPFGWHKLCPEVPAIPILDGRPLPQPSFIGRLPLSDINLNWNPFKDADDGDSWLFSDESSESNSSDYGSDDGTSLAESENNSSDCDCDDGDLQAGITHMHDCDESSTSISDDESRSADYEGFGYRHGAMESASRAGLSDHTRANLSAREEAYFEFQDGLFPLQPAQQVLPNRTRSSAARESFLVGLQDRSSSATTKYPPVHPTTRVRSISRRSNDCYPCLPYQEVSKGSLLAASRCNTVDYLV